MPASWASAVPLKERRWPDTVMVPASTGYTPVRALMSVDLPAPFSPSREWISPGRRVKSTPSSASTPGKEIEMSRISTAFTSSPTASRLLPYSRVAKPAGRRDVAPPVDRGQMTASLLVLAGGQSRGGLVLVEGAVDGGVGLVDLGTGEHVLDDRGNLVTEERVALHDVVELALRKGGQTIVRSIDGDDLDVRAGRETGGLDRVKGTEAHVVVLSE